MFEFIFYWSTIIDVRLVAVAVCDVTGSHIANSRWRRRPVVVSHFVFEKQGALHSTNLSECYILRPLIRSLGCWIRYLWIHVAFIYSVPLTEITSLSKRPRQECGATDCLGRSPDEKQYVTAVPTQRAKLPYVIMAECARDPVPNLRASCQCTASHRKSHDGYRNAYSLATNLRGIYTSRHEKRDTHAEGRRTARFRGKGKTRVNLRASCRQTCVQRTHTHTHPRHVF